MQLILESVTGVFNFFFLLTELLAHFSSFITVVTSVANDAVTRKFYSDVCSLLQGGCCVHFFRSLRALWILFSSENVVCFLLRTTSIANTFQFIRYKA